MTGVVLNPRSADDILLQPPFVRRWDDSVNPLPKRVIGSLLPPRQAPAPFGVPSWQQTGPPEQPFDFCGHMSRLSNDISGRCPELQHIDTERLLFAVTRARNRSAFGLQARVTPLRFGGGRLRVRQGNYICQVERFINGEVELLYHVTFCLPRFLNLSFDDKLTTLFHELYHISPDFNGDLRRHKGRYFIHSHSRKCYDRGMTDMARAYLATGPDPSLLDFLRLDFGELEQRHGSVVGTIVPRPKIVSIPARQTSP